MNATTKAANPQCIICGKTVYARESGLNSGENTRPDTKIEQNGFADPKILYTTTVEQGFSAAC